MNRITKQELNGPDVFVLHHFCSDEECEALIRRSEAAGFADAPVSTPFGAVMRKDFRDNTRVMVDDLTLAAELWTRARSFLPERIDGWEPVGFNERFRFYRYDPAQKFAPHFDGCFRRLNGEQSRLTFMVYLNDVQAGGETNFYLDLGRPHLSVQPEPGKALIFVHRQLHEGAPVVSGRKYVLRTDVMYRRVRAG
jgi:hypothetical protein